MEEKKYKTLLCCFLFTNIVFVVACVMFYVIFNRYDKGLENTNTKELTEIINYLDSIDLSQSTIVNHYQTNIKNEKKTINQNFSIIDSLSIDSAYQLWSVEARQYKPVFN